MPLITALEPQKRKKDRFNLFLDGEFAFGVSAALVLKHNLAVGMTISEKTRDELIGEEELVKQLDRAYRLLSSRPRSRRELERYFALKQVSPPVISLVLRRLEENGLVNDRKFAEWWVEQRLSSQPKGERALAAELKGKGIDREIIAEILSSFAAEINDPQRLESLARKALKSCRAEGKRKARRKLWAYLSRRGYPSDMIRSVVDKAVASAYNGAGD
jgi:regulatory protein